MGVEKTMVFHKVLSDNKEKPQAYNWTERHEAEDMVFSLLHSGLILHK